MNRTRVIIQMQRINSTSYYNSLQVVQLVMLKKPYFTIIEFHEFLWITDVDARHNTNTHKDTICWGIQF